MNLTREMKWAARRAYFDTLGIPHDAPSAGELKTALDAALQAAIEAIWQPIYNSPKGRLSVDGCYNPYDPEHRKNMVWGWSQKENSGYPYRMYWDPKWGYIEIDDHSDADCIQMHPTHWARDIPFPTVRQYNFKNAQFILWSNIDGAPKDGSTILVKKEVSPLGIFEIALVKYLSGRWVSQDGTQPTIKNWSHWAPYEPQTVTDEG